jgi:hypothetical protein
MTESVDPAPPAPEVDADQPALEPQPVPEPEPVPERAAPGRPRPGSLARQVGLGAIAFVATIALLWGLASVVSTRLAPAVAGSGAATEGAEVPGSGGTATGSASSAVAPSPPPSDAGSAVSGDPVLIGAGDIADCNLPDDSATADIVAGIAGTVFTAGDNAYPDGMEEQFRSCYAPTWGRFVGRTRPAPGNHDHVTPDLAGYRAYFGEAAGPKDRSWYAYDLGTWHIVVLDSSCADVGGCGPGSAQGRWLADDLATSAATCTLAIWHHPRWSSGEHGDDRTVAPLWQALYAAGADVVVNGHDHDYERFGPQDPEGRADPAHGIREFVVGTGGAALRTFGRSVPNSELRMSVAHGVIRFVLHDGSYDWEFIPTVGDIVDKGTARCH